MKQPLESRADAVHPGGTLLAMAAKKRILQRCPVHRKANQSERRYWKSAVTCVNTSSTGCVESTVRTRLRAAKMSMIAAGTSAIVA